jgi:phosphoglycerate dehydrogenase-like enzyme
MSDVARAHVALALGNAERATCSEALSRHGLQPSFVDSPEQLARALPDCEYLLLGRPPRLDWSPAVRLELLQIAGAGVDPLFPAQGLRGATTIANCRGLHADAVREHVLALLLAFARDLPRALAQQARREWQSFACPPLAGKTLVLLGHGAIGARVAVAARGFGLRVLAVTRSGRAAPGLDAVFESAELELAVRAADYFVICAPLTPQTRGLVDARVLAALPAHAVVINVSRGALLDHTALEAALRAQRLAGAALDVVDPEPLPPASSLWHCPRLWITPHVAGHEPSYLAKVFEAFATNVARLRRGEAALETVSRELEY